MFSFQASHRFRAGRVAAVACGVLSLAGFIASARAFRVQTGGQPSAPAAPSEPSSTSLPASSGNPFAALPNYAALACSNGHELRHWRQPVVTFAITPSADDKRTPAELRAVAEQALGLWKDKVKAKLVLRMANIPEEAPNVEIEFVPASAFVRGQIGNTIVSFVKVPAPLNDIGKAKIQMAAGLPSRDLVQAIAHECGHALGIEGHSDDNHDLMYPSLHLLAEISDRDANTFNIAYYQIDTRKVRAFQRGQKYGTAKSY